MSSTVHAFQYRLDIANTGGRYLQKIGVITSLEQIMQKCMICIFSHNNARLHSHMLNVLLLSYSPFMVYLPHERYEANKSDT